MKCTLLLAGNYLVVLQPKVKGCWGGVWTPDSQIPSLIPWQCATTTPFSRCSKKQTKGVVDPPLKWSLPFSFSKGVGSYFWFGLFRRLVRSREVQRGNHRMAQFHKSFGSSVVVRCHNAVISDTARSHLWEEQEKPVNKLWNKIAVSWIAQDRPANRTVCLPTHTVGTVLILPSDPLNSRLPGQTRLTPKVMKKLERIKRVQRNINAVFEWIQGNLFMSESVVNIHFLRT